MPASVTLITGASSGIGRATATAAAGRGHHVVLVARGRPSLEETATECRAAGAASALALPADVGDDAQVADVVRRTLADHGRLDEVVSNAGVVAYGRTEEVPVEVFDAVVRTNLGGSVNLARHVVPVLRRQRAGALLFVGSVIGHIAIPTMTPYVVSKWGVRALARQVSIENRDLPASGSATPRPAGSTPRSTTRPPTTRATPGGRLRPRRARPTSPDSCCDGWETAGCPSSSACSTTS